MMRLVLSRRSLVTQPLELKGQCPDYAHAQASYVFSKKDKRTAILTWQESADGGLLVVYIFK